MAESRHVQHCRWAQPTLFLAGPLWVAAEDYPWSCNIEGEPYLIEDPQACLTCRRWTSNEPSKDGPGGAWRGWRVPGSSPKPQP